MRQKAPQEKTALDNLFPEAGRILLTGTGKQFIERIGVETAREIVLGVLMGENVRTQTEPLTRQRLAQVSGALLVLFGRGWLHDDDFSAKVSGLAVQQLTSPGRRDKSRTWPAQWILGLTDKSMQNVLRGNRSKIESYAIDFEAALRRAAEKCRSDLGEVTLTLAFSEDASGQKAELGWLEISQLFAAIGSQTLTMRGSEKALYGKLFERLVLGTLLHILGFKRVNRSTNRETEKIFWLSDSSASRESDATILLKPGKLARFDIGFIGPGNPEISKDKLSRYEREAEVAGATHASSTFIVVDRLPETSKTKDAAERIGAEIIQMSMQYWPRDVAQRLKKRLGFEHDLQTLPDKEIRPFLTDALASVPIQDFLADVSVEQLETQAAVAADPGTFSAEG